MKEKAQGTHLDTDPKVGAQRKAIKTKNQKPQHVSKRCLG